MNESGKTLTFVAVGALALAAAYFIDSEAAVVDVKQYVGKYLNEEIDVSAPRRLRIVKFDRETADVREFEVAEVEGVWSIPSKQNYPADATRQMAEAATALMDRKILRVAAETAQDHADLGVVDPLSSNLDAKATGVGTRVIMTDAADDELVDMIIGKGVKGAEGQRYVRRSNQNVVYVVELDPSSLSTTFDDWIEDDLLKLNPFDIRKLFVNDYSADLELGLTPDGRLATRVNWDRRGEITLTYDNGEAKWGLADLKKFDRQKKEMVEDKMADDEEVDQDALGKLRNGLDDLLIVDIARKPDGLSADLKAGENFLKDKEAFQDLVEKGFSPVAINDDQPEILSSEGEIVCTLRDGVEYVLRFGQLQVQTESEGEGEEAAPADPNAAAAPGSDPAAAASSTPAGQTPAEKAAADKAEAEKKEGKNLRRYLFVMARFNKDSIEKPKKKDLPELPKQAEPPADAPADEAPAEDAGGDGQPTETAPADTPSDGEQGDAAEAADSNQPETDAEPAAEEAAATDSNDEAKEDAAGDDQAKDEADDETAKLEMLVAERKEIEEENQRLEDEYQETVKSGEKKVAELNERFGDWYYVISDDVYKQIHLGRAQIIKKKEKPGEVGKDNAAGAGMPEAALGLPNLPAAPAAEPAADQPAADAAAEGEENADVPAAPADSQ
jgi:hypothetical protein